MSILLGYLLGSVPSSYLVGRIAGNTDMRTEGDGRISAAAVYRRLRVFPFLVVVVMDVGLAVLAIRIATTMSQTLELPLATGLAVMVGHNWSIFLKFRGGLGATALAGALGALVLWQFLIGLGIAGLALLVTRRPGLSTAIGVIALSIILFIQGTAIVLTIFPLFLLSLMLIKRIQVHRAVRARLS
ncbi:glycerol-3-phosphate acyltransferase [Chloroflexota bacterium]